MYVFECRKDFFIADSRDQSSYYTVISTVAETGPLPGGTKLGGKNYACHHSR